MKNLYCYVDENGLETQGRLFVVAIVALSNPEPIALLCEEIEQISGKGKGKWGKTRHSRRIDYLRRVFTSAELRSNLCYVVFRNTQDYETATIEAISRTIRHLMPDQEYRAIVYIDALSKTKRQTYGSALRKSGIAVHKVQGVATDENNALIRLVDAVAGFVRDASDGESREIVALFQEAEAAGALVQV